MREIAIGVAAVIIDITLKVSGWHCIGGRFLARVRLGLTRNVVRVRESWLLIPIPVTSGEPPPATQAVIAAMVPTAFVPNGPVFGIEMVPILTAEIVGGRRCPRIGSVWRAIRRRDVG
jgi:hypothetical protein